MTKTQKKKFIIDTGILNYSIHVLYLFSVKELQRYSDKYFGGIMLERDEECAARMFPIKNDNGFQCAVIDFHNKMSKSNIYDLGIIIHEALHCILCAFEWIGVNRHSPDNEEFFCYSLDFVFRKIYEGLFT